MTDKKIIYVDMDDVLCDFTGAKRKALAINADIAFPQSQYGFYTNLQPLPNAIESMQSLLKSDKYDPYILTAPSVMNPLCYTEKRIWVEQYLGMEFVNRLIISPNKSLLKGHMLIDEKISGRGQDKFKGELINFGSNEVFNWLDVRRLLSF